MLFYTWPLKYIGLGEIAVLIVWGPLMIGGGYFIVTGQWDWNAVLAGLPYALGVTTVIFGKHIDKYDADKAKGIHTLPVILGERPSRYAAIGMMVLMYLLAVALVLTGYFHWIMLIVLVALTMLRTVLPQFLKPKPAAPPEWYPKDAWPLWFVSFAFIHNRRYGLLFLAGLIGEVVLKLVLKIDWPYDRRPGIQMPCYWKRHRDAVSSKIKDRSSPRLLGEERKSKIEVGNFMSATTPAQPKTSWLDRMIWPALNLDVEKLLYLILIVAAILTRFIALGDRAMSHDESLHAYYSWNLYKGGGFSHTPLMHGPFLFHINALIYSLFGADDFTARISVAVFGVALVALPYFMRRWLGRLGGLLASFLLLISPSIWYHARYIRDEAYVLTLGMIMIWGMFAYWRSRERKWLYLITGAAAFSFLSMESTFILCVIFGAFATVVALIELSKHKDFWDGHCRPIGVGVGRGRVDRYRRSDRADLHHGLDRAGGWRRDALPGRSAAHPAWPAHRV